MKDPALVGSIVLFAVIVAMIAFDEDEHRIERLLMGITVIGLLAMATVVGLVQSIHSRWWSVWVGQWWGHCQWWC